VLEDTRRRLETLLFRLRMQGLTVSAEREKWLVQHEEILTAMLAGNSAAAERLVARSSKAVREAILALPPAAFA
jgi:DNA-binding GntR family transcriptional regulator